MNVENMKILSVDDNKTNLLIIESYAKILNLQIESFLKLNSIVFFTFFHELFRICFLFLQIIYLNE